jgi:Ca2+-binding EF-hand superfamily protein
MDMDTCFENALAESREIFDLCDLNDDGLIDQDEFHILLLALNEDVTRAESQLDFEVVDTTGDGYIEFKEFVAWWMN